MAKGGGKGGKAVKEENEKVKAGQKKQEAEKNEADAWKDGAKVKDTSKEEKRQAELARKAELARLLAEEESSLPSKPKVKAAPKKDKKPVEKPAGPGALAAGGGLGSIPMHQSIEVNSDDPVEELYATGIDSMLEALEIANQKSDKASVGQRAAGIEAHPERRFKAALEKYIEEEMPVIRKDHPGLRRDQYREKLFQSFKKHKDNPYNALTVDYNATKDEKIAALKASNAQKEQLMQRK